MPPQPRTKATAKGLFRPEVFDGGGRCIWLKRWTLLSACGWEVYLHHWLNDDWSQHHHDHSRAMLSIGLWGRYTEHLIDQRGDALGQPSDALSVLLRLLGYALKGCGHG